jgi:hypothetical protein
MRLRWILEYEPELLRALHALGEGCRDRVTRNEVQSLMKGDFVTRTGKVRPDIRAVMIAGYRDDGSRPLVDEPFDLSDPGHAAVAQRYDELVQQISDEAERRLPLRLAEFREWMRKTDPGTERG